MGILDKPFVPKTGESGCSIIERHLGKKELDKLCIYNGSTRNDKRGMMCFSDCVFHCNQEISVRRALETIKESKAFPEENMRVLMFHLIKRG